MSSTLTNMLEGNATVYQSTRNTTRGGRDGGRRNGRHRGGRDGGRGTGQRGGRRQYAQPVAAQPVATQPIAAVSPPEQYAQAMVIPPPIAPGTGMLPPMDPLPMGYPHPYPYPYRPPGF